MISADILATGTGKSKKLAKHMAAKALLERIITGPRSHEFPLPGRLAYMTKEEALEYM